MRNREKTIAWGIALILLGILLSFLPKIALIIIILAIVFYYFREKIDII